MREKPGPHRAALLLPLAVDSRYFAAPSPKPCHFCTRPRHHAWWCPFGRGARLLARALLLAWLLAIAFGLVAGCSDKDKDGKGLSAPALLLTLENVDVFPADCVIVGSVKLGAGRFAFVPYGVEKIPPQSSKSFKLRPIPDTLGVICNGGWPQHTRRRDPRPPIPGVIPSDYWGTITIKVP